MINQKQIPQKQRLNRELEENFLPQETTKKSQQRKSSRLRGQPRKNYKLSIHNLKY